mmetsp:Transcript_11717/g.33838  ORF Transcript_11717/g.33838 Transcript_11717/m.33838 type:complete len:230 (-) Transcript_11717:1620-2309(-)
MWCARLKQSEDVEYHTIRGERKMRALEAARDCSTHSLSILVGERLRAHRVRGTHGLALRSALAARPRCLYKPVHDALQHCSPAMSCFNGAVQIVFERHDPLHFPCRWQQVANSLQIFFFQLVYCGRTMFQDESVVQVHQSVRVFVNPSFIYRKVDDVGPLDVAVGQAGGVQSDKPSKDVVHRMAKVDWGDWGSTQTTTKRCHCDHHKREVPFPRSRLGRHLHAMGIDST